MKIVTSIVIIFLSLVSYSRAENIKDFQIEGFSIGDSLLDFFNNKQILNLPLEDYDKPGYYVLFSEKNTGKYSMLGFHLKDGDKKYIIQGIKGTLFFKDKFDECLQWKKGVIKDINDVLPSLNLSKEVVLGYGNKDMKNSKAYINQSLFPSGGGMIRIWCTKLDKDLNLFDRGSVSFSSKEVVNFLRE